jgi:tetratricopeptide (TPR) repeat protein
MNEGSPNIGASWNLLQIGRLEQAHERARAAVAEEPEDAEAHRVLAEVHLAADRLDDAVETSLTALGLDGSPTMLELGARTHHCAGDLHNAQNLIDRAVALAPERSSLHVRRSLVLTSVAGATLDEVSRSATLDDAIAAADTGVECNPQNSRAWFARGSARVTQEDLLGASKDLTEAIRLEPTWPVPHNLLGVVRARQGMMKLSSRHFAIAGRLDPEDGRAIERLRNLAGFSGIFGRRRVRRNPMHLAPEARALLEIDRELGHVGGESC